MRSAAEVLARGGLHRDAAILFRDKIGDKLRAAHEFANGGAFDEALAIYEEQTPRNGGDLLRRIGDEEAAIQKYIMVAHATVGTNPLGSGEFLLAKTGQSIWRKPIFESAGTIGTAFADATMRFRAPSIWPDYADRDPPESFLSFSPGRMFFASAETPTDGLFFNGFASLAANAKIAPRRDEVRRSLPARLSQQTSRSRRN